ncbi:MAG: 2-oxoacid:acceptor oxidoreductase subunit alpha [Candidatus Omnitrophica bacterium]|nr:2-oxoacid:acceptor oxidoreductase subunit alpha [Candidatus Omnitrophota bacterium]
MKKELTILIAGEAGQGMQTIGATLCRVFKDSGCFIFANQDYMSRVRGGNNFFQLRVAHTPSYTLRQKSDIIVALDKKSQDLHAGFIASGGIIIVDKEKFKITEDKQAFFNVPFYNLANTVGGSEIFINTVCCGVIAGLTGLAPDALSKVIKDAFIEKGEEIVKKNIACVKAGYDFAKANFKEERFYVKEGSAQSRLLMNGNEAIALGAIRAGCKFYSAYPMTPSTSIMDNVAHFSGKFNIVVEQAEDEIAAINMIIGASFAGARSMAATSGGGFALMVEGLSLAGMTETPIVVVCAQRPGPATGFPTRTEQSDLNFLIHAGHGEFARLIYAPGTIEEAFYLTIKAFNMAEKYQIPVLILTDQHLADSYRNIEQFDLDKIKVQRYIISKEESKQVSGYKRYQLTESGISPRAIPSWIDDTIYVDSDEHNEDGHITEEASVRVKMVEKRFCKKIAALVLEVEKPTAFNIETASTILLGFGSTYGAIKEAREVLGSDFGFIHLSQVWPFPAQELIQLLKDKKRIFTIENNAGAQLAGLLLRSTGIKASGSILRFDGRPFNLDYLVEEIGKYKDCSD